MAINGDYDAKISAFADSHRLAMRIGDEQLAGRPVEKKILLALVAGSTTGTLAWVKTRVPDGARRARLLDGLSSELQKEDVIGKGLRVVEKDLIAQAKRAVGVAVGAAAAPAWWTSAVAITIGIFGLLLNVGSSFGTIVAVLLFVVVSIHIAPPVRAWTVRMLSRVPQVLSDTARSARGSVLYFWSYPDTIGIEAERIFIKCVKAETDELRGVGAAEREARRIIGPLRMIGNAIVVTAFVAVIASIVVFIAGFYHGFTQQTQECEQQAPGSGCGLSQ